MAIVWQKKVSSKNTVDCYEVRSAGRTRRLYTNGVFHSQYNPYRPVAGSVWDLLLLPAFFHPVGLIKRVLVLGVGGGAVMKQLEHFLKPDLILGVELNPVHLQVAKRFFNVKGQRFELIEADAVQWLKNYQGPRFDLIIDDLFGEEQGEPCRAVSVDEGWCNVLRRNVADSGSVVINFDTPKVMKDCFWLKQKSSSWQQAYQFTTPLYSNCIALFTQQVTTRDEFRENLCMFQELDEGRASCRLNYQLRKLHHR